MMRAIAVVASLAAFAACASDSGDDGMGSGSGSGSGSGETFSITTPDVTIAAGQEITYCYYTTTSNADLLTIKRWQSDWTAGSHHVILYFTPELGMPAGTMDPNPCGFGSGSISNIPSWIYSAQTSPSDMTLPADDGTGKPLGMDVPANQPAMLEVHYNNVGDDAVVAHATVTAEAYEAGIEATKTYAYVTYMGDFEIPGETGATGYTLSQDCAVPTGSKFWLMSTHAHKHAIHTEVRDGDSVLFESDNWEHPGAQMMTDPFYSFSGQLTDECTWENHTGTPVFEGSSAKTNEMCMASGYYFPATKAKICYNGFVL
jgi:hypothetical protein